MQQPRQTEDSQSAAWTPSSLSDLDDRALLEQLKRLVGSSNHLTALMLAHLAEVDARAAYRQWACPTLFIYCVYELRLSEDEARRRCRAARVARQFPLIFEMLADGSIHLTGILQLAPYLAHENHVELLARSRYRRKREIEKLLAEVAPRCDVPSLIQPLSAGTTGFGRRAPSTWNAMMESRTGYVRQLTPGDLNLVSTSRTRISSNTQKRRRIGARDERTDDFLPMLQKSLDTPGVHVIDVPVDYSENRIFTRELERSEASSASMSRSKT